MGVIAKPQKPENAKNFGEWCRKKKRGRDGYPCFRCNSTGRIPVAGQDSKQWYFAKCGYCNGTGDGTKYESTTIFMREYGEYRKAMARWKRQHPWRVKALRKLTATDKKLLGLPSRIRKRAWE